MVSLSWFEYVYVFLFISIYSFIIVDVNDEVIIEEEIEEI